MAGGIAALVFDKFLVAVIGDVANGGVKGNAIFDCSLSARRALESLL